MIFRANSKNVVDFFYLTSRKPLTYLKKAHIATLALLYCMNVCCTIWAPLLGAAKASLPLRR